MNKLLKSCTLALSLGITATTFAANEKVTISLNPDANASTIAPEIYGQFAEHLGTCIYGGLWVGTDSSIPNTQGYRNDVLQALRDLKVPVLRWPGGCFADEYHWQDGIGPKENRPRMVNSNWGGTVEDNSFGTHEFFNLCELIGCEPYLSGNVGSGTVKELAKWVEYITAEDGPMATLRKQNGREKPWHLKYLGVGNESWGCGGSMFPEYYADQYRRYSTYCRDFNGNKLYKVASGASDYDYNWTDVLMKKAQYNMDAISLHYYTVCDWNSKGQATNFSDDDYYTILGKCLEIEDVVKRHIEIMDSYDPDKRVGLLVDEWGTWWDEEPGTIHGHLYQQNTLRDAMVAALTLNVFHKYTDRVRMTNIAQIANVLQSMVLTHDDKMVLTPTYYVFKMYTPHQGAKYIPIDFKCSTREVKSERSDSPRILPTVSATASEKNGIITISLANVDLKNDCDIEIPLTVSNAKSGIVAAEILTSADIRDYNDFDKPDTVKPTKFDKIKISKNAITLTIPAKSIITISVKK
jgi:alpha-N-arabinofuranosidase